MAAKVDEGAFARQYIDYIYIPAALLVVGTAIVKIDWTPYAALLAVALGTWNYFSFRKYPAWSHVSMCTALFGFN